MKLLSDLGIVHKELGVQRKYQSTNMKRTKKILFTINREYIPLFKGLGELRNVFEKSIRDKEIERAESL